jgi:hypothetical protein
VDGRGAGNQWKVSAFEVSSSDFLSSTTNPNTGDWFGDSTRSQLATKRSCTTPRTIPDSVNTSQVGKDVAMLRRFDKQTRAKAVRLVKDHGGT